MEDIITRIYCDVDDFCIRFENYCVSHVLYDKNIKKIYPKCRMSLSEVMTITILFHSSGYRCFKWFYMNYVCKVLKSYFPNRLSYNRFVEVMQYSLLPLLVYTLKFKMGECTGISFIDSTPLKACHEKRIYSHKVLKEFSGRGKNSTGWYYGLKLHLVVNEKGELISFCITPGNVDDRNTEVIEHLCDTLKGKVFGDKGYISKKLFKHLFEKSIQLVTKIKRNMKNKLMDIEDKILLRKRSIIETINDFLKNICQIEHTRHRSVTNFFVNVVSGLAAYCFLPKKPKLNLNKNLSLTPIYC